MISGAKFRIGKTQLGWFEFLPTMSGRRWRHDIPKLMPWEKNTAWKNPRYRRWAEVSVRFLVYEFSITFCYGLVT